MSDSVKGFGVTIFAIFCFIFAIATVVTAIIWLPTLNKTKQQHVHFFDTNECYDIKSSCVEKGIAYITFNDKSELKCSADNCVVYVEHPCDYCEWYH